MQVQLGNHSAKNAVDEHPSVTVIHIPDSDEQGLGGHTHEPGLTPKEFREHWTDAQMFRDGITHLPEHEALLSIQAAWGAHSHESPAWVRVTPNLDGSPNLVKAREHQASDIENFLRDFYQISNDPPDDIEGRYHTQFGAPGDYPPVGPPPITNLFLNDGRVQQANNYGGGQVGTTGQATSSAATTLTNSGAAWTVNQWAGYRVYASVSASAMVWGNVLSNTSTALTVDRWYAPATPGGSAGSTPSGTAAYLIADGGVVSAWFMGLTATNITPGATDHALSGEYTVAGGGLVRKICPYALTSGTSPMTMTLTPVFTANGTDTLPQTFYAISLGVSMVVAATTLIQKFEASLSAPQTISASGDQLTVTSSISGS